MEMCHQDSIERNLFFPQDKQPQENRLLPLTQWTLSSPKTGIKTNQGFLIWLVDSTSETATARYADQAQPQINLSWQPANSVATDSFLH